MIVEIVFHPRGLYERVHDAGQLIKTSIYQLDVEGFLEDGVEQGHGDGSISRSTVRHVSIDPHLEWVSEPWVRMGL